MKVELLEYFGNDLKVVNAARVSYGKESDYEYITEQKNGYPESRTVWDEVVSKNLKEQDIKLLNFLIQHGHTSPFRHPQFTFRITCPIYIERQLFKHTAGVTVNSISGRYVDFSDSYSPIKEWRKQSTNSKQGSDGLVENQDIFCEIEKDIINVCSKAYETLIKHGVSKEQARAVLPLSLNTTFIMTMSLQALLHMFDLRLKSDTQFETREVVWDMYQNVINIPLQPFKTTLELWQKHNKEWRLD